MRAAAWLAVLASLVTAAHVSAQTRIWSNDERTTITSFNEINALAFDGRRVFAASPNGLEIYDPAFQKWLPPSTLADGYPAMQRPVAIVYDRGQAGLWLSTVGGLLYFRSDLGGRWDIRGFGPSDNVLADALRQSRAGDNDIALRIMRGTVGVDPSGRRWPITAVVPAERPGTYWMGTAGGNLLLADSRNLSSQWYLFGTLARGTSALAVDSGGNVWFGGDGLGPRDGIAHSDSALQKWQWFDSYAARAPRAQVNRIIPGDTTWVAAADGLYALLPGARTWQRFGQREGLPSDYVRTIARTSSHLWVGTTQGVATLDPGSMSIIGTALPGTRVYGMAARNDTVWIATRNGLLIGTADSSGTQVVAAPGIQSNPYLRGVVDGIANAAGKIAALTEDGVFVYDSAWSDAPLADATVRAVGRILDLRASGDRLYVLGSRGIAEWHVARNLWSYLTVPGDVAEGPARDVVKAGPFLWVATSGGATRLRWP